MSSDSDHTEWVIDQLLDEQNDLIAAAERILAIWDAPESDGPIPLDGAIEQLRNALKKAKP